MTRAATVYALCKGQLIRETEKAVFFRFDSIRSLPIEPSQNRWIPLSQVEKRFTKKDGGDTLEGEDTMMVAEWILEKVGIL